jgi:7-carboxy-7-deazaguanine synthase
MGKSIEEVMEAVFKEGHQGKIKNVSITGGDPLHPTHVPQVLELIKLLKEKNYYVNIEAAGTRVVDEIFELVDYVSFDYKTPSTGVKTSLKNLSKMIEKYPNKFQVKAVISDERDFSDTLNALNSLQTSGSSMPTFPWVLTPCYNTEEAFPMDRFVQVLEWNEETGGNFRVIGQQHKWIFGPNEKQV